MQRIQSSNVLTPNEYISLPFRVSLSSVSNLPQRSENVYFGGQGCNFIHKKTPPEMIRSLLYFKKELGVFSFRSLSLYSLSLSSSHLSGSDCHNHSTQALQLSSSLFSQTPALSHRFLESFLMWVFFSDFVLLIYGLLLLFCCCFCFFFLLF